MGEPAVLQSLWGGYGELLRLPLLGGSALSVILKRVRFPAGEGGSFSDQRKRRSYEVERCWYERYAPRAAAGCRMARCLGTVQAADGELMLLEDLCLDGYVARRPAHREAGLRWLAQFHAVFLGEPGKGLWPQGSYWHLATRAEEWRRMPAGPLKEYALDFDRLLQSARWQGLVHGDAKPANFLWSEGGQAAAVDFQYVGHGAGVRDLAYFLDCCLRHSAHEDELEQSLQFYFECLQQAAGEPLPELEQEWRRLFPVAWSDYQRFLQGWAGPTPLSPLSQQMLGRSLELLSSSTAI